MVVFGFGTSFQAANSIVSQGQALPQYRQSMCGLRVALFFVFGTEEVLDYYYERD